LFRCCLRPDNSAATNVHSDDTVDDYDEDAEAADYDEDEENVSEAEGDEPEVGAGPQGVSHHSHAKTKIPPIPPESSMFVFSSTNR